VPELIRTVGPTGRSFSATPGWSANVATSGSPPSGPSARARRISPRTSATGESHSNVACASHEHGMFPGDWLLYGRVHNAQLESLVEPWK
jgi:hypothetical protein